MYELMVTISILVDDIQSGVEDLRSNVGLIEQRPASFVAGPGISAVFARVHPSYEVAPTFLELAAAAPADQATSVPGILTDGDEPADAARAFPFPMPAVSALQGTRAIKWHATEVGMSDEVLDELAAHLETLGISPGWWPPVERDRCYIAGDPASDSWNPSVDAGLFIEAIKRSDLRLPEAALVAPANVPAGSDPASMVRIIARQYLVEDLDRTLVALARSMKWRPSSITESEDSRQAVMPFSAPRSARLELVQPMGAGRAARAYEELGPGAWTVRIGVVDLDAKAKDLEERGTPFSREDGALRPDPAYTLRVPFEFVTA